MNEPRVDFDPNVPTEIVSSVGKFLPKYLWMLPSWAKRIYVFLGTDSENPVEVMGERAYRRVQLYISPNYIAMTELQREESVLHEIVHIVSEPIRFKYKSILEFMLEKGHIGEDLHNKLYAEYIEECEGMTQDLTFSITDFLMKGKKNEYGLS